MAALHAYRVFTRAICSACRGAERYGDLPNMLME